MLTAVERTNGVGDVTGDYDLPDRSQASALSAWRSMSEYPRNEKQLMFLTHPSRERGECARCPISVLSELKSPDVEKESRTQIRQGRPGIDE